MPQPNTSGNGQHSIRSINVRANLLSEWTQDQVRFRSEGLRYTLMLGGALLVLGITVPALESVRSKFLPAIKARKVSLATMKGALDEANHAKTASQPEADSAAVSAQTHRYFNRLIVEMNRVLQAPGSDVVLNSTRVEVRAAEILLDCRADAASFEAAQDFASTAGMGTHKVSTLASIRPGALFEPNGISFDYLKRIELK